MVKFISGLIAGGLLCILWLWLYKTNIMLYAPSSSWFLILAVVVWSLADGNTTTKKRRCEIIVIASSICSLLGVFLYGPTVEWFLRLSLAFAIAYFIIRAFLDVSDASQSVFVLGSVFIVIGFLSMWWRLSEQRMMILFVFSYVFTTVVIWLLGDMFVSRTHPLPFSKTKKQ